MARWEFQVDSRECCLVKCSGQLHQRHSCVSCAAFLKRSRGGLSQAGAAAAPDGLAALLAQFELLECKDLLEKEGIRTVAHLKELEESDLEKLEPKLGVLNTKRFRRLLANHVPPSPSVPLLSLLPPP